MLFRDKQLNETIQSLLQGEGIGRGRGKERWLYVKTSLVETFEIQHIGTEYAKWWTGCGRISWFRWAQRFQAPKAWARSWRGALPLPCKSNLKVTGHWPLKSNLAKLSTRGEYWSVSLYSTTIYCAFLTSLGALAKNKKGTPLPPPVLFISAVPQRYLGSTILWFFF